MSGSFIRPRTLNPYFHEVCGCSSSSLATPEHPHTELNWRLVTIGVKSVLPLVHRTTYLGVVQVSTMMQACLSPAHIESILATVKRVREGQSLTVKLFQKLLGLMAAASKVITFGLLHMRPLQWWLRITGFSQRGNPFRMIKVTRQCLRALDMWK